MAQNYFLQRKKLSSSSVPKYKNKVINQIDQTLKELPFVNTELERHEMNFIDKVENWVQSNFIWIAWMLIYWYLDNDTFLSASESDINRDDLNKQYYQLEKPDISYLRIAHKTKCSDMEYIRKLRKSVIENSQSKRVYREGAKLIRMSL